MQDSRLNQITAALDDARSIIIDIVDERPTAESGWDLRAFNHLDASRQCVNAAIKYIQMAASPNGTDAA